jgi:hypothetical protein
MIADVFKNAAAHNQPILHEKTGTPPPRTKWKVLLVNELQSLAQNKAKQNSKILAIGAILSARNRSPQTEPPIPPILLSRQKRDEGEMGTDVE